MTSSLLFSEVNNYDDMVIFCEEKKKSTRIAFELCQMNKNLTETNTVCLVETGKRQTKNKKNTAVKECGSSLSMRSEKKK